MEPNRVLRILLVDSDLRFTERVLSWSTSDQKPTLKVTHVERLSDAIRMLRAMATSRHARSRRPDAVVLNLAVQDCPGPEGLTQLQDAMPDLPVVVLTTLLTEKHSEAVLRMDVVDCLRKETLSRRTLVRALGQIGGSENGKRSSGAVPTNPGEINLQPVSYECSADGSVTRFSGEASALYVLNADGVIGSSFTRLVPEDAAEEATDVFHQAAKGNPARALHTVRARSDGFRFSVVASVFPLFDPDGNVSAIAFAERPVPEASPTEPEKSSDADDRPFLLVVEDNQVTRAMLTQMLEPSYRVMAASGANDATELATRHQFDALVLDISLGERLTGVEVLHAIRSVPSHQAVPAVACTAYALPGLSERLLQLGFSGYISKPLTRKALMDTIEEALKGSDADEAGDQPVRSEPPDLVLPPMPWSMSEIVEMLADPNGTNIERLAGVLERDAVLASWVLHHVNSAFYAVRGQVSSIERAVMLLGFEPICNLVLSKVLARAFAHFEEGRPAVVYEYLQRTGVATSAYARALSVHLGIPRPDLSFTAGLLHQLGRFGLLSMQPQKYAALWFPDSANDDTPAPPTLGNELIHFGTDHVAVGAEIARSWDLPRILSFVIQRQSEGAGLANTPESLVALAVAAGSDATERLYAHPTVHQKSDPESTGPRSALFVMARHFGTDVEVLDDFLRSQDDDVQDLVGHMLQ